ncbi:MAG: putative Zn-dependent protease [Myxococcota bacterium]
MLIAGVAAWMLWERKEANTVSPYASLAVVASPRVEFSGSLPESAEAGMMDLARGDCQTAAAHFRTAGRRNPNQTRIRVLEGASFLCAGDSKEAVEVLKPLADNPDPSGELWWFLAQACLLEGDASCAMDALTTAEQSGPRYRERASRQKRQLQVLLSTE